MGKLDGKVAVITGGSSERRCAPRVAGVDQEGGTVEEVAGQARWIGRRARRTDRGRDRWQARLAGKSSSEERGHNASALPAQILRRGTGISRGSARM